MNIFRRITATVSGSIEQAATQLENHDAIVEVALKQTRAAAAKAKVRLTRVQRDGKRLAEKLTEHERMISVWETRARKVADSDEAKALECISRRNRERVLREETAAALADHEARERDLVKTVERIDEKLAELDGQRNLLRTRHSAAQAERALNKLEADSSCAVDDVLERWEMRILETEYATPALSTSDSLDDAFRGEEDSATLRADLDDLLGRNTDEES